MPESSVIFPAQCPFCDEKVDVPIDITLKGVETARGLAFQAEVDRMDLGNVEEHLDAHWRQETATTEAPRCPNAGRMCNCTGACMGPVPAAPLPGLSGDLSRIWGLIQPKPDALTPDEVARLRKFIAEDLPGV